MTRLIENLYRIGGHGGDSRFLICGFSSKEFPHGTNSLNGRDSHTPLWALMALNGRENYQNYKVPSSSFSQHQWEERLKSMGTNPKSHQQDTFSPAWCFLAPVKGPLFPRVTPGRSNKARAGGQIQLVQMWERIPQATWPSIEVFTYQMDVALADAGLKKCGKNRWSLFSSV